MSIGRAALQRWVTPAAVLLIVLVLVASAAAIGTQIDSTRSLPRIRGGVSGTYARDAIGALPPVSAQFARERLGATAVGTAEQTEQPPPRQPTTVAAPPDESIKGSPGAFPGLAPGGWVLTARMVPNRTTVRAGEEIRYRMLVGNTGSEDFRGRSFTLEWHTPSGTFGRNAPDQCDLLALPLLRAACAAQRLILTPGVGEARHESFNSSGLVTIDPGEQWPHDWYVQVLPSAAAGTTLVNHAHLTVRIDGRDHTIRTGDVVVTVVE